VTSTVAEGAPVSSGQPLVTVTDASTLSLTAEVDETDVLLVSPGVDASAELDAVPGATYDSSVEAIDPAPTTSTRGGVSYVVRLSLGRGTTVDGTTAPAPRPGMSAVVDLRVRTARDVVAAPAPAVFRAGKRDAVWVVKNGRAVRRLVRLGAQGESRVEVLEGLKEGERLVVRGADRVRDGQQVG
jgi:HlyD family secretion protein